MDNPNPIKYSDLITPDGSVTTLISQLEQLIGTYDKLKGDVQGQASAMAKSMQGLSGATEEQRRDIIMLTETTEKLEAEYRKIYADQVELKGASVALSAARKEEKQVLKLLEELNVSAEGSYKRLSAQYRLIKIRLNEMSLAEREGTGEGRKLVATAKALYEEMNRLQKETGKATLQVGQYERALGGAIGVGGKWLEMLTNETKATETFAGVLNVLKTPIGALIGVVGAGIGVFKLWRESVHETQTTGNELDTQVAGWSASWDVFKKAVATMDFRGFITSAAEAAAAGRDLQEVLDDIFARAASTTLTRAAIGEENEILLEGLRDRRKNTEERIADGKKYLENIKPIYEEEAKQAQEAADKEFDLLFAKTDRNKQATEEEKELYKEQFRLFIQKRAFQQDEINQARAFIKAEKDLEQMRVVESHTNTLAMNEQWRERKKNLQDMLNGMTEDQKQYVQLVKQFGISSKEDISSYVKAQEKAFQASSAYGRENRRVTTQIHTLEATQMREAEEAQRKREEAAKKAIEDQKAYLQSQLSAINLEIAATQEGTDTMLDLRIKAINKQREIELFENKQKAKKLRQDEAAINAKYDAQVEKATADHNKKLAQANIARLQAEAQDISLQIEVAKEGTQEMLDLRIAAINKQREIEIEQNKLKTKELRQDEKKINDKYDAKVLKTQADFNTKLAQRDLAAAQSLAAAKFALENKNEREITIFRLQQEKERLEETLRLNEEAAEKMTETEIAAARATIDGIKKQLSSLGYNNIYEVLGISMNAQQQSALNTALGSVRDSLGGLVDSWKQVADAATNAAQKQVDAAQKALDAEIEARNNGYANNVKAAQKELELQRKNLAAAQREQEKAQRAQLALDTTTQASSLITASANIWKAFGEWPPLAIAALTTMWGSFIAAKVRAWQVAGVGKREQYGEGTVELLQGGSHASGHDIDLGTKRDGTRRRAEGGEYFAVINKRNSKRFGSVIPDVINSLNDGTFADKYQRANAAMDAAAVNIIAGGGGADLSGLERNVEAIRKQGDENRFVDGSGTTIVQYKNLTRKIRS